MYYSENQKKIALDLCSKKITDLNIKETSVKDYFLTQGILFIGELLQVDWVPNREVEKIYAYLKEHNCTPEITPRICNWQPDYLQDISYKEALESTPAQIPDMLYWKDKTLQSYYQLLKTQNYAFAGEKLPLTHFLIRREFIGEESVLHRGIYISY